MRKFPIPLIATVLFMSIALPHSLPMSLLSASTQSTNTTTTKNQWGLEKINAPSAWDQGATGSGITVAVIDTGIDYNNKDLSDRIGPGVNIITNSTDPTDIQDTNGHGTEVASIIGGTAKGLGVKGIAPDVTLMPIKVTLSSGGGLDSDVAKGLHWAADHGANIINISMGQPKNPQFLQEAILYAQKKGCLIVAASGNHNNIPNPGVLYPAGEPGVLAVSAIDHQGMIAGFSNTGPQIALSAPGVHIFVDQVSQSYSHTGYAEGTSTAAPFVSGAAALLWSKHPDYTADQIASLLEQSAVMPNSYGRDDNYGFGLLDIDRALTAASLKVLSSPATIDYSGGVIQSDHVQMTVPPFSFEQKEIISLTPSTVVAFPTGYTPIGTPVSISFDGTVKRPLTLSLPVPSYSTESISVFKYSTDRWIRVGGTLSDHTLTTTLFDPGIYQAAIMPALSAPVLNVSDPVQTSINVALAAFPTGSNAVILARSDDFSDALTGVPLATRYNAPILLNPPQRLDVRIFETIQSLKADQIIILGGTGAIYQDVEDELLPIAPVTRYAGIDRYETATKIASVLGTISKAFIVNGTNYSDALTVAPFAAAQGVPILLSDVDTLPGTTKEVLNRLRVTDTIIAGGSAVVSENVKILLPRSIRLSGYDSYATNIEVLNNFNDPSTINVPGSAFAPALVESVRAAMSGMGISYIP